MDILNPTINFTIFNNRYDSSVSNHNELPWYEFAELLTSGHKVTDNKDVMLFGPWKFKTTEDDFEPRLTQDGDIYLVDGKPVVGRLASNVVSATMICLDYDGTMSIDYAKSKFAQWAHIGYTSYSHKAPKKNGADCFRIVLPLTQEVTPEQIADYRDSVYKWSEGADETSLSIARCFYVPSVATDRQMLAQSWRNDGELFDLMEFEKKPEYTVNPLKALVHNDSDLDRRWLIDNLKSIYVGQEPVWYKVAITMYSNKFSFQDFVEVTLGGFMREKSLHDCEKKWNAVTRAVTNSGKTMTVGYLFNLLKQHGIVKQGKSVQRAINDKIAGRA